MDCIPYINDLQVEINILKDIKNNNKFSDEKIDKKIEEKELLIKKCKDNLSKLSINSIEYRIYLKILEGMKPSKAISKVAEENYINGVKPTSEVTIYKYYYPNLKKVINV